MHLRRAVALHQAWRQWHSVVRCVLFRVSVGGRDRSVQQRDSDGQQPEHRVFDGARPAPGSKGVDMQLRSTAAAPFTPSASAGVLRAHNVYHQSQPPERELMSADRFDGSWAQL